MELLTLLAGMFLGYAIGKQKTEVRHTVKVDARDGIKQLKEATEALKNLEKEIKW